MCLEGDHLPPILSAGYTSPRGFGVVVQPSELASKVSKCEKAVSLIKQVTSYKITLNLDS